MWADGRKRRSAAPGAAVLVAGVRGMDARVLDRAKPFGRRASAGSERVSRRSASHAGGLSKGQFHQPLVGVRGGLDVQLREDRAKGRHRDLSVPPQTSGSGALWRYAQQARPRTGAATRLGGRGELRCHADV